MTVPVGLATFFILPDTPYTTRAWFLTEEECELSVERVRKAGKAAPVKITLNTFVRILSRWRWYAFVLGYVVSSLGPAPPPSILLIRLPILIAVWLVMPGQQLLRHLVEIRTLLCCRQEHHPDWHEPHLGYLRGALGVLIRLHW